MFPYPKKEASNQTQMNKSRITSRAEESLGNTVLGAKRGTPEIPCGGSTLKHQGCICPSLAQSRATCRLWP